MRVLVACETSGTVREAFRELGHDAYSCDLLDSDDSSQYHIVGDALATARGGDWDLVIAHPPCTYLAVSGMHWTVRGLRPKYLTDDAVEFARGFMELPCKKICVENPVSVLSTRVRKPDQIIQPYQFGHPESKRTCLWLKGLPKLEPTDVLSPPEGGRWQNQTPSGQNKLGPSPTRWKDRSRTYVGIAKAMANQWGALTDD